ncbi:MAG: hypothetical protein GY696_20035 [Gammaproteobacteria bacterium]|nr:hypothetical protein [Gammaproteobacteria bacterium]
MKTLDVLYNIVMLSNDTDGSPSAMDGWMDIWNTLSFSNTEFFRGTSRLVLENVHVIWSVSMEGDSNFC